MLLVIRITEYIPFYSLSVQEQQCTVLSRQAHVRAATDTRQQQPNHHNNNNNIMTKHAFPPNVLHCMMRRKSLSYNHPEERTCGGEHLRFIER